MQTKERHLIRNAIKTPDGTVIESTYRHDFVCHTDANGERYCVDGGRDYLRRVGAMDYEDMSLYDDEPHEVQRNVLKWGSYGKDGKSPVRYIPIAEMETDHIQAVLQECRPSYVLRNCMLEELKFRGESCEDEGCPHYGTKHGHTDD